MVKFTLFPKNCYSFLERNPMSQRKRPKAKRFKEKNILFLGQRTKEIEFLLASQQNNPTIPHETH